MMVEHNQSANNPTNAGYNNAYKFNGKELDDATGMYYYGARYYDPRISIFVSVDPLAEDFVGWTPYHYVHQNPINLIDPTGMSADPPEGEFAQGHRHTDNEGTKWQLNGSVWENQSGGDDQWQSETLNEIVINTEAKSSINWGSVARQGADFVPIVGSGLDIYEGIRDGNGWQVAMGVGGLALDVATMGIGGAVVKGGAKALIKETAEQGFKSFTKSNYRHNLKTLTKSAGKGMDAHHIFPQAKRFKGQWDRVGLNIHDPNNLMWWQKSSHRKNAKGYNKAWDSFFENRPEATLEQIQEFGNSLMKSHGH